MNIANIIYTILIGGTATSLLTEFLKLSFIPIAAQKYPRITAGILSVGSSVGAFFIAGVSITANWQQVVASLAGIFVLSAIVYNQALKGLKTGELEFNNAQLAIHALELQIPFIREGLILPDEYEKTLHIAGSLGNTALNYTRP